MFHITPITENHIEGFHRTLDMVAHAEPYLGLEKAPPLEHVRNQVAQYIKQKYPLLVAVESDEILGWCSITPYPQTFFRFTGQLFVGVLSQWRGRGIGSALIRSAISAAWTEGLRRIELEVCLANQDAVRLYRKLGFVDEGVKRHAYFVREGFDDILMMSILRETQVQASAIPGRVLAAH